ncbi:MAG: DUF2147 domain-containing protein, partial [Nitrospinae bacterium]|nr:DUF2147 domain-containing protein [Nitrospinota bacterium]
MKGLLGIIIVFCVFGVPDAFAVKGDDILGFWVTEGGNSRIEIYKTGN